MIPDPNLLTLIRETNDQLLGDLSAFDENFIVVYSKNGSTSDCYNLDGYTYNEKHYIVYYHHVYTEHITNGVYIQSKYNALPMPSTSTIFDLYGKIWFAY